MRYDIYNIYTYEIYIILLYDPEPQGWTGMRSHPEPSSSEKWAHDAALMRMHGGHVR